MELPLYHGLRPTQDIVFQYLFSSPGCEPGLDVTYHKFREFSQDEQLRLIALHREMAEYDRVSALNEAEREGLRLGRKQGIEQGIKKGIEQGIEKGRELGVIGERAAKIIDFLRRKFPYEFSSEIESKLLAITNVEMLDTLFWEAVDAETIQEVTKYL